MRRRQLIRVISGLAVLLVLAAFLVIESGRPGIDAAGTKKVKTAVAESATARLDDGAAAPATAEDLECKRAPMADASTREGEMSFASLQADMARLSVSRDPEHLLALAILRMDDNPESSLDLMSRALEYDPGNPLLLAHLAETCHRRPEAPACASREPEQDLLRVAGSNGATWARTAARRRHRGDSNGALDALRRAITAPAYDEYWVAHVMLFERALAASTDHAYPQRIVAAIGVTTALDVYREFDLLGICDNEMDHSVEWLGACTDFGKRMEADSRTLLGKAVGIVLQTEAYEAAGEPQELARASRRRTELEELMQLNTADAGLLLMSGDANVISRFMEEFAAHGELAAMRFMHGEAERLEASGVISRDDSAINCFGRGGSADDVASASSEGGAR